MYVHYGPVWLKKRYATVRVMKGDIGRSICQLNDLSSDSEFDINDLNSASQNDIHNCT